MRIISYIKFKTHELAMDFYDNLPFMNSNKNTMLIHGYLFKKGKLIITGKVIQCISENEFEVKIWFQKLYHEKDKKFNRVYFDTNLFQSFEVNL